MQPEESFDDVPFCDLCNASVPLQDLEQGAAVRHQGKTIGACCLGALRAGVAGAARAGHAAHGSGSGGSGSGGAGSGGAGSGGAGAGGEVEPASAGGRGGDSRLLPFAIALLAALAAVTIFLDYRLAELERRSDDVRTDLEDRLQAQSEVMQSVRLDLDAMVRRGDVDALQQRILAVDDRLAAAVEQTAALGEQLTQTATSLRDGLREVEARRPDYGPVLTELRQQLQQQAVTLAELLAMPRARREPVAVEPEPVVAAPGMPAELSHQIGRLADEDPAARFEAVDELLRSKDLRVLEHLLPMLQDDDLFVRRLVVEGLRDFRDAAVVDALIVALADPEDIVRDTAWRSLKELTGQKLPFEASGSRDARARAQERWQEWWQRNRDSFGT